MLQRGTFSFVYLHRFWFTMRARSAGWCFAFLKIPHQMLDSLQIEEWTLNINFLCFQDIKRVGIFVISNKFGSFQLLAPECPVLLVLWHIVCIKKLSYYLSVEPHPKRPLPPASFYPFSASCLALYPCYRLGIFFGNSITYQTVFLGSTKGVPQLEPGQQKWWILVFSLFDDSQKMPWTWSWASHRQVFCPFKLSCKKHLQLEIAISIGWWTKSCHTWTMIRNNCHLFDEVYSHKTLNNAVLHLCLWPIFMWGFVLPCQALDVGDLDLSVLARCLALSVSIYGIGYQSKWFRNSTKNWNLFFFAGG